MFTVNSGSDFVVLASLLGAVLSTQATHNEKIRKLPFGKTVAGHPADLYLLTNNKSMEIGLTNYGASIVSLKVPDRAGKSEDIVLGYENVSGYEADTAYLGATIGRYGNRIAHGQFTLAGMVYRLAKNDGDNTLHGGIHGFNKKLWNVKIVEVKDSVALEMSYLSNDGEEGFAGNLQVKVIFKLPYEKNELCIEYKAETDKDTVVNLTNHSYFNLAGHGNGDILSHKLAINASKFTPIDATLIPTGELREVENSPFDFTKEFLIGARIDDSDEQLKFGKGYDHNWVLDKSEHESSLALAAEAVEPISGRVLTLQSTEPGIQFYSGNFLDGTARGKGNKLYPVRSGFCLETQHFPDSPNKLNFPSTVIYPGLPYHSTTVFRFSTRE